MAVFYLAFYHELVLKSMWHLKYLVQIDLMRIPLRFLAVEDDILIAKIQNLHL